MISVPQLLGAVAGVGVVIGIASTLAVISLQKLISGRYDCTAIFEVLLRFVLVCSVAFLRAEISLEASFQSFSGKFPRIIFRLL